MFLKWKNDFTENNRGQAAETLRFLCGKRFYYQRQKTIEINHLKKGKFKNEAI